jgi:hypothetical protein
LLSPLWAWPLLLRRLILRPAPAIHDWSGFYIGFNGGGALSHKCWDVINDGIGPIPASCCGRLVEYRVEISGVPAKVPNCGTGIESHVFHHPHAHRHIPVWEKRLRHNKAGSP